MGSTEVYILGQKYTIKGDAPEEYIREIASYVDAKLKEVHNSIPNITPVKASILAALDIADELFKLRNEQELMTKTIEEKAERLASLFD
jgi:cell division protein ZapA